MSVGRSRKFARSRRNTDASSRSIREFKIHGRGNTKTILAKSHKEYLQLLRNYFGLEITGAFIK